MKSEAESPGLRSSKPDQPSDALRHQAQAEQSLLGVEGLVCSPSGKTSLAWWPISSVLRGSSHENRLHLISFG